MVDELIDRFGEPPKSVQNLLAIALLKEKAHRAYITEIASRKKSLRFSMYARAEIDTEKIPELIASMQRRLRFVPGPEPYFLYEPQGSAGNETLLQEAEGIVDAIQAMTL